MVGRTCKAEECGRIWMSIKISHRVCDREQVPPSHLAHAHGSRCLRQNQILCPCSEKWLGFGRGGENAGRMNRSNYGWNRWCMPAIPCILPECKRPAVHFSPQTTSRPPRNRSIKFLYAQMNHHLALQFFKPPPSPDKSFRHVRKLPGDLEPFAVCAFDKKPRVRLWNFLPIYLTSADLSDKGTGGFGRAKMDICIQTPPAGIFIKKPARKNKTPQVINYTGK